MYPYVVWPFVYYFGYPAIDVFFKAVGLVGEFRRSYSFEDLLWQLAFGVKLCPPLWFQFDLIIVTILFWVLFRFAGQYAVKMIVLLGILSIWLQYSGINNLVFGKLRYEMQDSLGRIVEMIPLAVIGFMFAYFGIFRKKENRYYVGFVALVSLMVITAYDLFILPDGFVYGGLAHIMFSVLFFILAYEAPIEKMPIVMRAAIRFLAKYSFGVFYLHYAVGRVWNGLCAQIGWQINTFLGCVWIYVICIIVLYGISKVPSRYAKMLVE